MTQQVIGLGTAPNDSTGDSLRVGGAKINANFTELYTAPPVVALNNIWTGINEFQSAFKLSGDITPPTLTADVNDYSPSGFSTCFAVRLDTNGSNYNITGLAGGTSGRVLRLVNTSATNSITLLNQNAGSAAANRFLFAGDVVLAPLTVLAVYYDAVSGRWRPWSRALTNSGVTAGAYGSATQVPSFTVDLQGRLTLAANVAIDPLGIGAVPLAGGTMSGALVLSGGPTLDLHAATKLYVDTVAQGLDAKASVKVATTANITLSGEQTIDGVLTAASRVLVKSQTAPAQNGIYVSAAGAWTRSTDADAWTELPGAFTFVEEGTVNGNSGWTCTSDLGGTLGTTAVTWTQFSGAGTYLAGTGLSLTGSTFAINDAELLAIAGLTSAADQVPYFTGAGTAALAAFTAAGRSVVGAASIAAVTALLSVFVGDTGSGGTKGLVPAPITGDATKFLKGDGTWATVSSGITEPLTLTRKLTITQGTVNEGILASTGYSLTGSSAVNMLDFAGTLNTSGSPIGLKIAWTNTASGATTKFVSFLAGAGGATEVFSVDKAGAVTLGDPSGTTSAMIVAKANSVLEILTSAGAYASTVGSGGFRALTSTGANDLVGMAAGALNNSIASGIGLASGQPIFWGSSATSVYSGTGDLFLRRDAANTLAQRNGTTAQAFNLYNTWTDASNYERSIMLWSANVAYFGLQKAGTGAARSLYLYSTGAISFVSNDAGTPQWTLTTGGVFGNLGDNQYDLGAVSNNRPRTGYFGTSVVALAGTAVTADAPVLNLSQTWNNAGVTFTGMKLNVTSTASAAASLLMDIQLGGASVLSVRKDGLTQAAYLWATQSVKGGGALLSSDDLSLAGIATLNRNISTGELTISANAVGILLSAVGDVVAQRRGTTAQTSRIYNTWTDASNGEWLDLGWSANVATIQASKNGTGTNRVLCVQSNTTLQCVGATVEIGIAGVGYKYAFGSGYFSIATDQVIGWNLYGPTAMWSYKAAATIHQGSYDAASPAAQTYGAQGSRSGTDSNVGGANLTVRAGIGTGTGAISSLILQSPIAVGSGTGAQTSTTGLTIKNGTAVLVSYTVATLPSASASGAGAHAFITDQLTSVAAKGVAPTGGGSVKCCVISDGSGWVGI